MLSLIVTIGIEYLGHNAQSSENVYFVRSLEDSNPSSYLGIDYTAILLSVE